MGPSSAIALPGPVLSLPHSPDLIASSSWAHLPNQLSDFLSRPLLSGERKQRPQVYAMLEPQKLPEGGMTSNVTAGLGALELPLTRNMGEDTDVSRLAA